MKLDFDDPILTIQKEGECGFSLATSNRLVAR
jgi:hypothetical protein